jgi:hypothetical protein
MRLATHLRVAWVFQEVFHVIYRDLRLYTRHLRIGATPVHKAHTTRQLLSCPSIYVLPRVRLPPRLDQRPQRALSQSPVANFHLRLPGGHACFDCQENRARCRSEQALLDP